MLWSKQIIVSRKLVSSPGLMGMGSLWCDTMRTEHQSVLLCQDSQVWLWRKLRKHTLSHDCLYASQLPGSNIHTKDTARLEVGFCNLHSPGVSERLSSEGVEDGLHPACQTVSSDTTTAKPAGHRAAWEIKTPEKHRTASQWLISLNILGLY